MSNYAIASSGDAAQDQKALDRFEQNETRIRAGNCPNGCGGMIERDEYNAECLKCGFVYFSSGGLNFERGVTQ